MSRTSRIALLCLCFLCIIALAVILATALFSGRGGTDADGGVTGGGAPSESVSQPPDSSEGGGSPSGAPSATPTPTPSPTPSTTEDDGERVSFRAPGSENTLTAIIDTDRFRYTQNGTDAFFDSTVENDRVYIEFCYFAEKSAAVSAPSFLGDYVEHTDFNDRGMENIGGTGLSGYSVFASDGVNSFEAWLIDENQGGMLAIVMSYPDEAHADALRAIFNSLKLG
ncbi:MAG: hypothetical protein LBS51_00270 [Oscillospiraceae bacterium]|jgi:hypothetical protein|nr:hypothetical protein [Oscillospiraceae bacterium]